MKKLNSLIVLLVICISTIFGQTDSIQSKKTELYSVDLSTGKSALSSGLSLDFNLKGPNANTQITLRQDRIFVNHLYSIPKLKMSIGPSFGYFQNVPFGGVIGKFSPFKFFSTLHWVGYSFGTPNGEMSISPSFLFLVNSANINVWRLRGSYSIVNFMELPAKHVVSICYQHQIAKNFTLYTDAGYDMTNKEQLLKFGVIWKQ
jgi:hypothetical protein